MDFNVNLSEKLSWLVNGRQATESRPASEIHTRTVVQACYRTAPTFQIRTMVHIKGEGLVGMVTDMGGDGWGATCEINLAYRTRDGRFLPTGQRVYRRRSSLRRIGRRTSVQAWAFREWAVR